MTNMNNKTIRQIIVQKYLDAETSVEEENALFDFYNQTNLSLDDEEEMVRQLILSTSHLTDHFEPSDDKVREFDRIMSEKDYMILRKTIWHWIAAACIAVILVVLLAPPKYEGGKRKLEGVSELNKEYRRMKEEVQQPSEFQERAKHITSSIKHQMSNIKISHAQAAEDQNDLMSVDSFFGTQSRHNPMEEYTALEEKLQSECDEVFQIIDHQQ